MDEAGNRKFHSNGNEDHPRHPTHGSTIDLQAQMDAPAAVKTTTQHIAEDER